MVLGEYQYRLGFVTVADPQVALFREVTVWLIKLPGDIHLT